MCQRLLVTNDLAINVLFGFLSGISVDICAYVLVYSVFEKGRNSTYGFGF
jgi:hypothetical protein